MKNEQIKIGQKNEMKKPKREKMPKRPRRMRREHGIGDFLSWMHSGGGLRQAVSRVAYEDRQEKLFKDLKTTEVVH